MRKICQIADHLHFGMIRNCQIIVNQNTTDPINRNAERLSHKRSIVPRRPNFHAAWNEFVAYLQPALCKISRVDARTNFHAKIGKLFQRACGQILRKRGQ